MLPNFIRFAKTPSWSDTCSTHGTHANKYCPDKREVFADEQKRVAEKRTENYQFSKGFIKCLKCGSFYKQTSTCCAEASNDS